VREPIGEGAVGRVLLALNAAEHAEQAVNAALAMAAGLHAELAGLFVEDVNLLRAAQLPFARETGVFTAVSRPLELVQIERALRHQAQTLERALAAAARRSQLSWSFSVVRGQLLAEALAREADLMLLAGASAPVRRSFNLPSARLGPVVAVFDASPNAYRTLAAAVSFAAQRQIGLLVAVLAADHAQFEIKRQQAQQWLERRGASARYLHATQFDVPRLLELVRAEAAAGLVLPQDSQVVRQDTFVPLLAGLDCPLFVAR
jgi:hypothetical protein